MTIAEHVSRADTDYPEQLRQAARRYDARSARREERLRAVERRGVLQANDPDRVTERLARLNADWSLARSVERAETGPGATADGAPSVAAVPFGPDLLGLERVMGRNDLIGVAFLEAGRSAARPVGRVTVRGPGGGRHGTGFMVSPSLLMTNNHVLRDEAEAERGVVEFDYQDGPDGHPLASVVFALEPRRFFATDRALDFTVVAVAERDRRETRDAQDGRDGRLADYRWLPLDGARGKVLVGETVNIVQHPNGEPKQVALRENTVVDLLDGFVQYTTDSAPGSSGSPVFNDQWEVVALHHSAVPVTDEEGRPLDVDGGVWSPEAGEHRVAWKANEGVRVSSILRALGALSLTGTAARLRDELFRLPAGDAAAGAARSAGAASGAARAATAVRESAERDLAAALVNLRLGDERDYYDADGDRRARDAYYAPLGAVADGGALRRALSSLLEDTHDRRPAYQPARMVYPWVDLRPDRRLRSVYSGKSFDAEEFIRADVAAEAVRLTGLQDFLLRESTAGPGELASELDALEAASPFNCEHVVPQSWFAKREPMRGDLHHLFACEAGCNSFRGNIPYQDFPDFEEVVREDCGLREAGGFEPSHGKGAVARATLYFLLRYPGLVGESGEFPRSRLPVLLAWHEREPVDEYERHRNAAVAEIQGNRNPLTDHPEWAREIDFSDVWA
ncbi:endonuclease [Streptomyces fragilis]|uniref:Endonuclease n=1 Tax=Streptomyces fragilis TaxID=67301 RepID=A0ABV2YEV3_9ACTN|nr:endonuclease [Streptomyces fragilis]